MPKDFMCISLCVLVYVYDRVKHNRRVFFNAIVRYVLKKKKDRNSHIFFFLLLHFNREEGRGIFPVT